MEVYFVDVRLTAKERDALHKLCREKELTPARIMRQALAVYQLVNSVDKGDIPGGVKYVGNEFFQL